jgi:hypothetical protein
MPRLRTRLDLFNEALQPDPDPGEVWRENYRRQEEADARADPWSAPATALRQMRSELNAMQQEHQLERNHAAYQQAALAHEAQHPGYCLEIYRPINKACANRLRRRIPVDPATSGDGGAAR